MKKSLTLKNILILGGALLCLAAFALSFFAGIYRDVSSGPLSFRTEYRNMIWGTVQTRIGDSQWGNATFLSANAILSLIGYILIGVGGLLSALVVILGKAKKSKAVIILCVLMVVTGIVFVFLLKESAIQSYVDKLISDGSLSIDHRSDTVDTLRDTYKDFKLGTCVVISAICGIAGALSLSLSQLVKTK